MRRPKINEDLINFMMKTFYSISFHISQFLLRVLGDDKYMQNLFSPSSSYNPTLTITFVPSLINHSSFSYAP